MREAGLNRIRENCKIYPRLTKEARSLFKRSANGPGTKSREPVLQCRFSRRDGAMIPHLICISPVSSDICGWRRVNPGRRAQCILIGSTTASDNNTKRAETDLNITQLILPSQTPSCVSFSYFALSFSCYSITSINDHHGSI